jgi:hypothetical protein
VRLLAQVLEVANCHTVIQGIERLPIMSGEGKLGSM